MTWEEAARGPVALVLGTGDMILGSDALPALLVLARLAMTSNMALTSRSSSARFWSPKCSWSCCV